MPGTSVPWGESLEVLVISTAEDGSEQTPGSLCAVLERPSRREEMEPEPSETNSHVHGKEVDCNTNPFGDGWTTSLAVR